MLYLINKLAIWRGHNFTQIHRFFIYLSALAKKTRLMTPKFSQKVLYEGIKDNRARRHLTFFYVGFKSILRQRAISLFQ